MYSLPSTSHTWEPSPPAKNDGKAPREHHRRLMSVNSAGNNFLRALHQRVALFKCVGFHGNSCATIFAAMLSAPLAGGTKRESYLQARGSSLQSERAVSRTTHGPHQYAINLKLVAIRRVVRPLGQRQRPDAYQLVAQLGARERLA